MIVEGILCDFFIFTLEQIIVLNKHYPPMRNLIKRYYMPELYRTCVNSDFKVISARIPV